MVTNNYLTHRFSTDTTLGDSFNESRRNVSSNELNVGLVSGDILSVESMLSRGGLTYDFDITLVKSVAGDLKRGRRNLVVRETLLSYSKLFDELSCDPSSVGLKIQFYVMRLKLDTLLVERLLRDFLNHLAPTKT